MRLFLLSVFPVVLFGCPQAGVNCDAMAAASLTVSLVDALTGAPIEGATMTFDSSSGASGDCETFDAGEYVCGWEVAGEITVSISAPGYEDASLVRVVEADECHVIQELATVELACVDC